MKNRKREIRTSGTVRDEDGNILIYSAKQACIRRNTLLPEQRTYPRLDLPKRRRP
jgi:hypothetical protein